MARRKLTIADLSLAFDDLPDVGGLVELKAVYVGEANSAAAHRIAQAPAEEARHAFLRNAHEGCDLMFERNGPCSDSGDASRLGILLRDVLSGLAARQNADHRRQNRKTKSHYYSPIAQKNNWTIRP
ncbi:hypothetical protein NKH69_06990 [Mesorhizobium sp. M0976]|uniref:hypothetical protein n=1 Tax=unclassified Mesorhizobium TaxID=325217 RepID=UPI003338CC7F